MTIGMKASAKAPAQTEKEYKYYTSIEIQEGDSLWSIAEKYCDDKHDNINEFIKRVQKMNNLSDSNIQCGTYLMIYYYSDEYKA